MTPIVFITCFLNISLVLWCKRAIHKASIIQIIHECVLSWSAMILTLRFLLCCTYDKCIINNHIMKRMIVTLIVPKMKVAHKKELFNVGPFARY